MVPKTLTILGVFCNVAILFGSSASCETYLEVSTGSPIFARDLLLDAVPDLSATAITDNVSVLAGRSLRYGKSFDLRSGDSGTWMSSVAVGLFEYSALKPKGIDIVVEPVEIRSRAIFLEADVGYQYHLKFKRKYLVSVAASIGAQLSYSSISIRTSQSNLLTIKDKTTSLLPYVQVKFDRSQQENLKVFPWLSFRFSQNSYREVSAGISLKF